MIAYKKKKMLQMQKERTYNTQLPKKANVSAIVNTSDIDNIETLIKKKSSVFQKQYNNIATGPKPICHYQQRCLILLAVLLNFFSFA